MRLSATVLLIMSLPALPAAATEPTPAFVRELSVDGTRVTLDLAPQVLALKPDEQFGEPALMATPFQAVRDGDTVPASLLVQKAKQFDDGLYAAVELAAQDGAGDFGGKRALLDALAQALAGEPPDPATATLQAAAQLGGGTQELPAPMARAAARLLADFSRDALRSKPIGFYTWSPQLTAVFRQDRMLQSELAGAGIAKIATTLQHDRALRENYEHYLELTARLTNPGVAEKPDLRPTLAALDAGKPVEATRGVYFFPPSRAHETELVKRLFGDRPIPDGFDLIDEMAKRIRAGTLDLTPTAESGWYDWSTWALETLAAPERAAEAPKLWLHPDYQKELGNLFRGTLALTRETHIKQLEVAVAVGAAAPMRSPDIVLQPQLRAEPLATYYLRRAQGYRFVADALRRTFGAQAVAAMHRVGPRGASAKPLADELNDMQALFFGAYAATCEDLGLAAVAEANAGANAPAFLAWRENLSKDPDLAQDARMMVPLFFDRQRGRTKVLAFLGWRMRSVTVRFATEPRIVALEPAAAAAQPPKVRFAPAWKSLVYPVTAEIYVDRLLDRDEFRALCSEHRTQSAILQALAQRH